MRGSVRWIGMVGCCATAVAGCGAGPSRNGGGADVRTVLSRTLPLMDGGRLSSTVLEVAYGPGGSSLPHRHPCAVIGYVIKGALRSATDDEPETTYRTGEGFYERPHAVHRVSANASERQPVRFVASFICDQDVPLSVVLPEADTTQRRQR